MTQRLFISDLHLSAERMDTVQVFLRFLAGRARQADHLYILGDLFDVWVGDDYREAPVPEIKQAMFQLSQSGTRLWLMHGNRDFLLGAEFCRETGAGLLPDPSLVDLHGTPTLLMHGDLLCSDDQAYQGFRRKIRDPLHIKDFLGQSLRQRLDQARNYRLKSGEAKSLKSESIMDVNQQTVESYLIEHGAERLIHGHTHRPADHHIELQGKRCDRHVLAQWQLDHGELICLTPDGLHRERVD